METRVWRADVEGRIEYVMPYVRPCPFCGEKPKVDRVENAPVGSITGFRVRCRNWECGMEVKTRRNKRLTLDEAVTAWNIRKG